MQVKTCTRCGASQPLDQFPPVRRGEPKLQTWCRGCFAEANARNYRRDKENTKARTRRNSAGRRDESRRRAVEYLLSHPCVDCGETDIIVLEFDHVRDKSFDIGTMIALGASWLSVQAEIAKCEVRCANCHRRKTARELGYRKAIRGREPKRAVIVAQLGLTLSAETPLEPTGTLT